MKETTQKNIITFDDFIKLDLRVGRVLIATAPNWSNKLLELTVDFGDELGQRTIMAGVKEWYSPEELEGNNYIFVANLAERKMGQSVSQGMMLAADVGEQAVLLPVPTKLKPGTLVR